MLSKKIIRRRGLAELEVVPNIASAENDEIYIMLTWVLF